ncbi:MAG: alanine--glyoxylate aminotransferase family protein [Acidaminobacteraceae bacterium]
MNKDYLIMTPGPTEINQSVLDAMATKGTNPDLDKDFFEVYKDTVTSYNKLIAAKKARSMFLAGEGILGLEAACASLIEEGDKVLCIANGVFGEGFKGFVEMYGGQAIMLLSDWDIGINISNIEKALEIHKGIKLATLIHCETPSAITNDIDLICRYLNSKGILSIVDSVSAIGGEKVTFDDSKIDVLLGGSQKCLSSPAGMTMVTLSQRSINHMKNRSTPIRGYYLNLMIWEDWYDKKWFPYTQPLQNILGLKQSIENTLKIDFASEHKKYGEYVREHFLSNGYELYAKSDYSNTVTAVKLPPNVKFDNLFDIMKEKHGILIGGGIGQLKDKVFRIGHMGENNKRENFDRTFEALSKSFKELIQ